VAPDSKSRDFDRFAKFLQDRTNEWDVFIKTELELVKTAASIAACEDVPLWQPVNDLVEGSYSIWSTMPPTPTQAPPRLSNFDDNDVLEGFDGSHEYIGNRRFRNVVAALRDEFLTTTDFQEREKIAKKVMDRIHSKGGVFRRLDSDGVWRHISSPEATNLTRSALEKGFATLLLPYTPRRGRGLGANVLECEVAPMYDLLSDRKRRSIVIKMSTDDRKRQCLAETARVRAVADL
jgi:hypothetical protein